jgi:hypothetical protein
LPHQGYYSRKSGCKNNTYFEFANKNYNKIPDAA